MPPKITKGYKALLAEANAGIRTIAAADAVAAIHDPAAGDQHAGDQPTP